MGGVPGASEVVLTASLIFVGTAAVAVVLLETAELHSAWIVERMMKTPMTIPV